MLVSFIIPSYDSAHTVKRCLDSIYALLLKQEEFEVIFIDDCSTDNTCEIVAEYQAEHPNITLLKQPKNNRQGAARNRGVSVAKGEYICFVDSDDAVTEGIVNAIRMAKELQTDMTAFHTGSANEDGTITNEAEKLVFKEEQILTGVEMQNKHPYWCSAPWGYIYSKAFMDKTSYPFREGVLYEDSDFVAAHLYYAQRMAYSPALGYIAYYRDGSTTHSNSYKNQSDYLLLGTRMLTLFATIQSDIDLGQRTDHGIRQFADGVLEGACHNVTMSLKRIYKLNNPEEIVSYYHRVDSYVSRRKLYEDSRLYRYPNYRNNFAKFCLKHKYLSIVLNTCLSICYHLYKKYKH